MAALLRLLEALTPHLRRLVTRQLANAALAPCREEEEEARGGSGGPGGPGHGAGEPAAEGVLRVYLGGGSIQAADWLMSEGSRYYLCAVTVIVL